MAVELRNALGKRAGVPLPATLAFDYPTTAAMAKYLLEKVLSNGPVAATTGRVVRPVDEPIAMSAWVVATRVA